MSIKKTVIMTVFISAVFVGANFMIAQAYEPLVRIPGLPATGDINLSQYVVGLYNFLLSIVGIVAVMMLIIGGMKYITAAGNASIISDAKDTIWNAIFGLLLALLSWVIVSTINPDVLYIKNPTSSFTDVVNIDHGACGTYDAGVCTCNDGTTPVAVDQPTCHAACSDPPSRCGLSDPLTCVYGGSFEKPIMDEFGDWGCRCVDGIDVTLSLAALGPPREECNEVCQNPAFVTDGLNHCYVADFRIGFMNFEDKKAPTYPTDYDRVKAYAIYDTTFESPLEIMETCILVINAVDYTVGPAISYDLDFSTFIPIIDGVYNVNLPGGYMGFWGACNMPPYAQLITESECKTEVSSQSVTCPLSLQITFQGGVTKEVTQFIKVSSP